MNDVDYEAIEAAVTETVRGRWFLKEFARRNRGAEVKLMLDAMSRLETLVASSQSHAALPAPPSADPSIRLMVQRIKEIGAQLEGLASIMREDGIEAHFCEVVELQARAVSGLMRTGTVTSKPEAQPPARLEQPAPVEPQPRAPEPRRLPHVDARPYVDTGLPAIQADPRLETLSGLDRLPLAKKLALFT